MKEIGKYTLQKIKTTEVPAPCIWFFIWNYVEKYVSKEKKNTEYTFWDSLNLKIFTYKYSIYVCLKTCHFYENSLDSQQNRLEHGREVRGFRLSISTRNSDCNCLNFLVGKDLQPTPLIYTWIFDLNLLKYTLVCKT